MQLRGRSLVALAVCLTVIASVPAAGQDASRQAIRITVSPDPAPRGRLARITYVLDEPAAVSIDILQADKAIVGTLPVGLPTAHGISELFAAGVANCPVAVFEDMMAEAARVDADGTVHPLDPKGVDFGAWVQVVQAQLKRNRPVPMAAAISAKGSVQVAFDVLKDGTIEHIVILKKADFGPFNSAACLTMKKSNPTSPLPPEYPADRCRFVVTFRYGQPPPKPVIWAGSAVGLPLAWEIQRGDIASSCGRGGTTGPFPLSEPGRTALQPNDTRRTSRSVRDQSRNQDLPAGWRRGDT
jgi:TonB family protein